MNLRHGRPISDWSMNKVLVSVDCSSCTKKNGVVSVLTMSSKSMQLVDIRTCILNLGPSLGATISIPGDIVFDQSVYLFVRPPVSFVLFIAIGPPGQFQNVQYSCLRDISSRYEQFILFIVTQAI